MSAFDSIRDPLCENLTDDLLRHAIIPFLDLSTLTRLQLTSRTLLQPSTLLTYVTALTFASDVIIPAQAARILQHSTCLRELRHSSRGYQYAMEMILPSRPSTLTTWSIQCRLKAHCQIDWLRFCNLRHLEIEMSVYTTSTEACIWSTLLAQLKLPALETLIIHHRYGLQGIDSTLSKERTILLPNLREVHAPFDVLLVYIARICDPASLRKWSTFGTMSGPYNASQWEQLLAVGYSCAALAEDMIDFLLLIPSSVGNSSGNTQYRVLKALNGVMDCGECCLSGRMWSTEYNTAAIHSLLQFKVSKSRPCSLQRVRAALEVDTEIFMRSFGACLNLRIIKDLVQDATMREKLCGSVGFWRSVLNGRNGYRADIFDLFCKQGVALQQAEGLLLALNTPTLQCRVNECAPILHSFNLHHWCGCYRMAATGDPDAAEIGPCQVKSVFNE